MDDATITERVLIRKLHGLVEGIRAGRHAWSRKAYKHKNLSTKEFREVWAD